MAITQLPPNPKRIDEPAVFIPTADDWVAALDLWTTEANALAVDVNADEVSAANSATSATASANHKGDWDDLTGALNIPASVSHEGLQWLLLNNLADVTASEPGVTADWTALNFTVTPLDAWTESDLVVAALNLILSAANYFTKTIATNSVFTFGTPPAGGTYGFVLRLTMTGASAPTFPASVTKWQNGVVPTFNADTTHVLVFITEDDGAAYTGYDAGEIAAP